MAHKLTRVNFLNKISVSEKVKQALSFTAACKEIIFRQQET